MRYRQVHLDFHTSEHIPDIGARFDKKQFQDMLRLGHVDSITIFAKCHHGWAYHPSQANQTHPHLHMDLLGAQLAACREIGVRAPIYISAGLDEKYARAHHDHLVRGATGDIGRTPDFTRPGYHLICMNTPYLDILVAQVDEVVRRYDGDGLFFDIVGVRDCLCDYCRATLRERNQDEHDPAAVRALAEQVYANMTERLNAAAHAVRPGLPIFYNGGHLRRGRRDLAQMNTHLELESLPTGGWGYDHFPLSAGYARTLDMDFLGMTGKFHQSWGEFGGYKHPNALRYEAALSLACGARCSIGDQLAPHGALDEATYALIGAAYAEVEAKQPWCEGAQGIADVALLSAEAYYNACGQEAPRDLLCDAGAVRMLLETHTLFDVVDLQADWSPYKVLVLPDVIEPDDALRARLLAYVAGGGQVLATGRSATSQGAFALDFGARLMGDNPYQPDYFRPGFDMRPWRNAAFIMYSPGLRLQKTTGTELGARQDPYFNRTVEHFCSHQHTPDSGAYGGPGMVQGPAGIYIAWQVFTDYAQVGSLSLRTMVAHALDALLGERRSLRTSLGAQGVATLTEQPQHNRHILHLLYAPPVRRGANVEIIEDLPVLHDIQVSLRLAQAPRQIRVVPTGEVLPFTYEQGRAAFTLPALHAHAMIEIT